MHFGVEFVFLRVHRSKKLAVGFDNHQFNHEDYFMDRQIGLLHVYFENLLATKQDVGFCKENLLYHQILNPIREYSFLF